MNNNKYVQLSESKDMVQGEPLNSNDIQQYQPQQQQPIYPNLQICAQIQQPYNIPQNQQYIYPNIHQQFPYDPQNQQFPNTFAPVYGYSQQIPYLQQEQEQYQIQIPSEQINSINFSRKIISRSPIVLNCHSCRKSVLSKVTFKKGFGSWISGCVIFLSGFSLGCCLIPCFLDDCSDAVHSCPQCNQNFGQKRYLID